MDRTAFIEWLKLQKYSGKMYTSRPEALARVHASLDRLEAYLVASWDGVTPQAMSLAALESYPFDLKADDDGVLGALCAYLQRPDLGRRLAEPSWETLAALAAHAAAPPELAFVIGDGLSARAIHENAVAFLDQIAPRLIAAGWHLGPVSLVAQARVAIGDEIGQVLGAAIVVILIGERPGLSSPDSLGAYLTYGPRIGVTDAQRNCISNIRAAGLSHEAAAHKLAYLLDEARRRKLSGVLLKDEAGTRLPLTAD